jgi:hypothetical protein
LTWVEILDSALVLGCEVLDKELVPWDGARLAATALMLATCGGLAVWAKQARGARRWLVLVVAVGLAAGWGTLAMGDDYFSPDAGPALRVEAPAYGAGLWIEACAPAAAILAAWILVRKRR